MRHQAAGEATQVVVSFSMDEDTGQRSVMVGGKPWYSKWDTLHDIVDYLCVANVKVVLMVPTTDIGGAAGCDDAICQVP